MSAFVLVLTIACVSPRLASAQAPRPAHDSPATRIYVTPAGDEPEIVGRLLALTSDAVTFEVDGQRRELPLAAVRRIQQEGDSRTNGAVIGAVILGAWCALVCGQGLDSLDELPQAIMVNAAVGGLIGAAIDGRKKGRTTIYGAAPGRSRQGAGMGFSIRF